MWRTIFRLATYAGRGPAATAQREQRRQEVPLDQRRARPDWLMRQKASVDGWFRLPTDGGLLWPYTNDRPFLGAGGCVLIGVVLTIVLKVASAQAGLDPPALSFSIGALPMAIGVGIAIDWSGKRRWRVESPSPEHEVGTSLRMRIYPVVPLDRVAVNLVLRERWFVSHYDHHFWESDIVWSKPLEVTANADSFMTIDVPIPQRNIDVPVDQVTSIQSSGFCRDWAIAVSYDTWYGQLNTIYFVFWVDAWLLEQGFTRRGIISTRPPPNAGSGPAG